MYISYVFFFTCLLFLSNEIFIKDVFCTPQDLRSDEASKENSGNEFSQRSNLDVNSDNERELKRLLENYNANDEVLFKPARNPDNNLIKRDSILVERKVDEKRSYIDDNTVGIVIDPRTRKAIGILENAFDFDDNTADESNDVNCKSDNSDQTGEYSASNKMSDSNSDNIPNKMDNIPTTYNKLYKRSSNLAEQNSENEKINNENANTYKNADSKLNTDNKKTYEEVASAADQTKQLNAINEGQEGKKEPLIKRNATPDTEDEDEDLENNENNIQLSKRDGTSNLASEKKSENSVVTNEEEKLTNQNSERKLDVNDKDDNSKIISNDNSLITNEETVEKMSRNKRAEETELNEQNAKTNKHEENEAPMENEVNVQTKRDTEEKKQSENNDAPNEKPLSGEFKSKSDYDKELEAQIKAKIDAINAQVKREIAAENADAQSNSDLNDPSAKINENNNRGKRLTSLLDEENSNINPELNVDNNDLPVHVRRRRNPNRLPLPLMRRKRANAVIPYQQSAFLSYRAEDDDDDDDEGTEFDDDGFDDRTSNLMEKRQTRDNIYSNYRKRDINGYDDYGAQLDQEVDYSDENQQGYAYDYLPPDSYMRYKRDLKYLKDPQLHGGGGSVASHNNIKSRNTQLTKNAGGSSHYRPRSVNVKFRSNNGKQFETPQALSNADSMGDFFGVLPQTYQGELTRLKRVKRSKNSFK